VSPQYHVVYDDEFTTVPNAESGGLFNAERPFDAAQWQHLVEAGAERVIVDDDAVLPPLHRDWEPPPPPQFLLPTAPRAPAVTVPEGENGDVLPPILGPAPVVTLDQQPLFVPEGVEAPEGVELDFAPDLDPAEPNLPPPGPDPVQQQQQPTVTRSGHLVRRPIRLTETMLTHHPLSSLSPPNSHLNPKHNIRASLLNNQFLMALNWNHVIESLRSVDHLAMMTLVERHTDINANMVEWMHPMALAAKANAEDNPTWDQAINGPDREGYLEACRKELKTLSEEKDAWDVVDHEDWMNVLPTTWAFKCKRYPDGCIRKLKARFCARGDRQVEGIDFFDTFAPVINWTSVRLLLILSAILGLSTKQVDYTAAFVHAPIDKDPNWESMSSEEKARSGIYLHMPRGFYQPGKVLKLKRSLYGLRQSPRNFFKHLKAKLESIGFKSNVNIDPCLFLSDKVICLVYVNDTLFFSTKEEFINDLIDRLTKADLDLEVEDSVAGFLGVHIDRNSTMDMLS
jgi:hypothetical protein